MDETQCRICLEHIDCLFKLDDIVRDDCYVWEVLNTLANVSIAIGDSFPQKVCHNCFSRLDQAFLFRLEVERNDNILHNNFNGYGLIF